MTKKKILFSIRILFIVLFLYTGIAKLSDYSSFLHELSQSQLLRPISKWLAVLTPSIELLIVALLLSKGRKLQGLYASFVLMLIFTVYLILLTRSNDFIPCDCGGFIEKLPSGLHILFNALLVFAASYGAYLERKIQKDGINKIQTLAYN